MPEEYFEDDGGYEETSWLVIWEVLGGLACVWVAVSLPYAEFVDATKDADYQILGGCPISALADDGNQFKHGYAGSLPCARHDTALQHPDCNTPHKYSCNCLLT